MKDLRDKLLPFCLGWKWAEDAIVDLWRMGTPDPIESVCPAYCQPIECIHIKRWLHPNKFKAWFEELQQRIGYEISAGESYGKITHKFGRTSILPGRR